MFMYLSMYLELYYEHISGFKHFDVIMVGAPHVFEHFWFSFALPFGGVFMHSNFLTCYSVLNGVSWLGCSASFYC